MPFDITVGIDYSGAATADTRLPGLQVYASRGGEPAAVEAPGSTDRRRRNWTRREAHAWLVELIDSGDRCLVGVDHGYSFPVSYLDRFGLPRWDDFLSDFAQHWRTDEPGVTVRSRREALPERVGSNDEHRLTERWTSSAKSVFQFDVNGSVATSTHAGLPWLARLRAAAGRRAHFWPFDGWRPPASKSVVAEVYPSVLRNRYLRDGRTVDQQDAYAVARWLRESADRGVLDRYFDPPLTKVDRRVARREGWILGVA